jgi:hypothetical protein
MTDEALRELERRARETGAPDDEDALLAALHRAGRLDEAARWLEATLGSRDLVVSLSSEVPPALLVEGAPPPAEVSRRVPAYDRPWVATTPGEGLAELLRAPFAAPAEAVRERVARALLGLLGPDVRCWTRRGVTQEYVADEYGKYPHYPGGFENWSDECNSGGVVLAAPDLLAVVTLQEDGSRQARLARCRAREREFFRRRREGS